MGHQIFNLVQDNPKRQIKIDHKISLFGYRIKVDPHLSLSESDGFDILFHFTAKGSLDSRLLFINSLIWFIFWKSFTKDNPWFIFKIFAKIKCV